MFDLIIKKYFRPGTLHIFAFSFIVFIVLNVIENVIHYNIGKYHDHSGGGGGIAGFYFTNPTETN